MSNLNILTRKQTKLWPFERSVLEDFITLKSKPPTNEDALLRFHTIHTDLQKTSNRQSNQREAAQQTVAKIAAWWIKAGFICQSKNGLISKLIKLVNERKSLLQDHEKILKKKKKRNASNSSKPKIVFGKIKENILGCKQRI